MSIASLNIVLVVTFSVIITPCNERTTTWPGGTWNIEDEFSNATGAFVGTLELSNIEYPNDHTVIASGRIVPRAALWGSLPPEPIELGPACLSRLGIIAGSFVKGSTKRQRAWEKYACELSNVDPPAGSVLIIYKMKNGNPELLYVMLPEKVGDSLPVEEFLTIRDLETTNIPSELRRKLIVQATSPKSPHLLWSYALRKLLQIDDDPERKFENVFSQKLQSRLEPIRIGYAGNLLTYEVIEAHLTGPHAEDARILMRKFADAFASAPNRHTAYETLRNLSRLEAVFSAHRTQREFQAIRDRLSSACQDATHAIHQMDEQHDVFLKATMESFGVECRLRDRGSDR